MLDFRGYSIAFALIKARKVVRGLREGLSEPERFAVADAAVQCLQEHGDPWKLSEPLPDKGTISPGRPWMPQEREGD
jgi:hypothetical protein